MMLSVYQVFWGVTAFLTSNLKKIILGQKQKTIQDGWAGLLTKLYLQKFCTSTVPRRQRWKAPKLPRLQRRWPKQADLQVGRVAGLGKLIKHDKTDKT